MGMKIRGGLFALCWVMFIAHSLAADPVKQLKGVYRGIHQATCEESPGGFADPPNQVFLSDGNRYADTFITTAVFPGDGTMTESVRGTTSFLNGAGYYGAVSVGTFVDTCHYTISMNANKRFTLKGSCSGALPTGPGGGTNVSVVDIDGEGQVSEDNSVIIMGASEPDANSLTLTNDLGQVVYSAQRLCAGTGTYVRVRF